MKDCIQLILVGNTDYGNMVADFFELLFGKPMDALPIDAALSVQRIRSFSFLSKHYCDGAWMRYTTVSQLGTASAAILSSIYEINTVIYLVSSCTCATTSHVS